MITRHKDEALRALEEIRKKLVAPEEIRGLDHRLLVATVDYAIEQILAIQEVKRKRKSVAEGLGHGSIKMPSRAP